MQQGTKKHRQQNTKSIHKKQYTTHYDENSFY
jgi:hypothetical protein